MAQNLKSDIINDAYSQLRISGLTVDPGAAENSLALNRLELMANEFFERDICTGYQFEDEPDINSPSGLSAAQRFSYSCLLATRLVSDFGKGKEPDPILLRTANGQLSFLYASTDDTRETTYPNRQAVGSGNDHKYRHRRFYREGYRAPDECETNKMWIDDVNDYVEHFDSYLVKSETVASYTIAADTGLTIVSDSLTSPDVSYRIKAVGGAGENNTSGIFQVQIVATTSDSRIVTRVIDFELFEKRDIS